MQQAEAFRTFSIACERLVSSIMTNRPLAADEAQIVEYYCKEILTKIAPYLPNHTDNT